MSNLSTPKEISPSSSFSTLPSSESPKTSVANLQANVLKNETKDASTPGEKVKTPTQSSQRKKTFTGCWTCRNRKVKCDLGRPQCNRCLKSKIKCEGYDIKLRWSTKSEKDPDEEYFQRRNIEFVVYPPEMTFKTYEEMDTTLAKLHSPSLISDETKVLGPFGVFQGVKMPPKKASSSKRKRKVDGTSTSSKRQPKAAIKAVASTPSPLSLTVSSINSGPLGDSTPSPDKTSLKPLSNISDLIPSTFPDSSVGLDTNLKSKSLLNLSNLSDPPLQSDLNFPYPHNDQLGSATLASDKLNDDIGAILSNLRSTIEPSNNTMPVSLFDLGHNDTSVINQLNNFSAGQGLSNGFNSFSFENLIPDLHQSVSISNVSIDLNNLSNIQNTRNLFSHSNSNSALNSPKAAENINAILSNENSIPNTSLSLNFLNNALNANQSSSVNSCLNDKKPQYLLDNNLKSSMPIQSNDRNAKNMDNDEQPGLVMVPATSIISNFLSTDLNYGMPTNSLYFSPEARHLLHYYIRHVVRLMTVVTHDSTPWKTVYLPRAINAIGCLTALGSTSPARNTVLHALLSVSSFHLASKYPPVSPQRQHFTDLGVQLKKHAEKFLNLCPPNPPSTPVLDSEHKDLITAVLSMVTVGVVSSDTSACWRYVRHCKKHIYAQLCNPHTKNTKETQILHRIYAFVSLMQDATNITPDRVDGSVLEGPEWNTTKEVESLGLNSVVLSTQSASKHSNETYLNSLMEPHSFYGDSSDSNNNDDTNNSSSQKVVNSIFDLKFFDGLVDGTTTITDLDSKTEVTSFKPSRPNKSDNTNQALKSFYDMEILSTYSMYGIPDSLTLLFNRIVKLARQKFFLMSPEGNEKVELKKKFANDCMQVDDMLTSWLYDFHETQIPPEFINNAKKAFILHTIAFYHSLCIYYYTIVRDVPSEKLQDTVRLVLKYLQDMLQINRNTSSPIVVPLLFPAFIAACEATKGNLAKQFDEWFDQMCIDGLGTYAQSRQVVKEVWRRRSMGKANCRWYQVLSEMGINILLT